MKITIVLVTVGTIVALSALAEEQSPAALSKEAREARKAQTFGRFDLDGNGRLDHAERGFLRSELKSKMDPVKKRIITTNQPPVAPR